MEFATERYIVRKLKQEDLASFYEMQSSEMVMRHIKPPLNYEESVAELHTFIDRYTDPARFYNLWAIESKRTTDFVGLCGVYMNELKEYEIAYRLREKFWGKGIGSEIVKALIDHSFEKYELAEIVAYVDEENIGSVKILEKEMNIKEKAYSESRERYYRKYTVGR